MSPCKPVCPKMALEGGETSEQRVCVCARLYIVQFNDLFRTIQEYSSLCVTSILHGSSDSSLFRPCHPPLFELLFLDLFNELSKHFLPFNQTSSRRRFLV